MILFKNMIQETQETRLMDKYLDNTDIPVQINGDVEGKVLAIGRSTVYIDLPPVGTGIIYGREFLAAKSILRKVNCGDTITAKVIGVQTEEGYIDLSLKEARKAIIWKEAEEGIKSKKIFEVVVKEANRGGLILEWNGVHGFIPASQLNKEHYPRVSSGDRDAIYTELKKLVGEKLNVRIIDLKSEDEHIIFSEEKGGSVAEREGSVKEDFYVVGEAYSGEVTGIVDFGIFVKVGNDIEGLVHISEIDWGLVGNLNESYSVGDEVNVKIIEKDADKYSFSIKELKKNPWEDAQDRYKEGDIAEGVVIKYNPHGAFASIEAGITGLIHISSFENDEAKLKESLEIGKSYKLKITSFSPEEQKLTLVPAA